MKCLDHIDPWKAVYPFPQASMASSLNDASRLAVAQTRETVVSP